MSSVVKLKVKGVRNAFSTVIATTFKKFFIFNYAITLFRDTLYVYEINIYFHVRKFILKLSKD